MMGVPEKLKELREAKGLSKKELSKSLDIPYTTYCGYEKGRREPKTDKLVKFAEFFGVSVDYIVGYTNNPAPHKKLAEELQGLDTNYLKLVLKIKKSDLDIEEINRVIEVAGILKHKPSPS